MRGKADMGMFKTGAGSLVALTATALAACSGGSVHVAACGPPPPVPVAIQALVYPIPGSTQVPRTVAAIVTQGLASTLFGPVTLTVTTAGGSTVASGPPGTPPSPLPSPLATPAGVTGQPFAGLALPSLAAATTYTVTYDYYNYGGDPASSPPCSTRAGATLGSFTTR